MRPVPCISAVVAVLLLATRFDAHAAEPSAGELARRALELGAANLTGLSADVVMTTTDKNGKQRTRELRIASKQLDGRVHTLVRFRSPSDVAGIALLAVEGKGGKADELTVYLPAYKRTRRIAPSQRGASFADTDFSYADFTRGSEPVDPSKVKRLEDATLRGRPVYVIEGPAPKGSPYARVRAWIDRASTLVLKAESYDGDGALLRTYEAEELAEQGGRTIPVKATMRNARTGSQTVLVLKKVETEAPPDSHFTERALERG